METFPRSKIVGLEDFSNPELKPYLDAASAELKAEFGFKAEAVIPDCRDWESAMALKTFDDFDLLTPGSTLCGVMSGTSAVTFALADRGCIVFATDRYLEITPRSDAAPASMMVRPDQYTRRPLGRGSVIPVHSDPRALGLPSNYFDGVYASGEIGRLGSPDGLGAAMEEIGRILKPGGVASVVAEFKLEGPNGADGFDDDFLLLTPDLIQKYIVEPSGLELLDAPTFTLSPETYDSRAVLRDFGTTVGVHRTVDQKKNVFPNLVVFHDGFLFCPIHLALRKPLDTVEDRPAAGPFSERFSEIVERQAVKASGVLSRQIHLWRDAFGRDDDELGRKNSEIVRLSAENAIMAGNDNRRIELQQILDTMLQAPGSDQLSAQLRYAGYSGFAWSETDTWPASRISSVIGVQKDSLLVSEGRAGVLCYGPYLSLPRGRYRVVFDAYVLNKPQGTLDCAVIQHFGTNIVVAKVVDIASLSRSTATSRPIELEFVLDAPITNAEFRIICDTPSNIAVRAITLIERRLETVADAEARARTAHPRQDRAEQDTSPSAQTVSSVKRRSTRRPAKP